MTKSILEPIKSHYWESRFVLNTAAVRIEGKIYLLYRALGDDEISRIGLAVADVTHHERLDTPIFEPEIEEEKWCEDPGCYYEDELLCYIPLMMCCSSNSSGVNFC